ncbi:EAL-associated domain-containing protein [Bacillus infantis]|uniref:EAL domain-containing protein n=1 Tax=Bacillus infantis TaxID=324767 RepID=A0A5D4RKG9_9BACI|nr:EAL-associated domain-containing protein [Bacillus infantis]TYS49902.1 EAL domain-containing protein [Bacillus infantis]
MDALDILTELDCVIPYFQAIFSADEHKVIGYEVLGRFNAGGSAESLGPFFLDDSIPEEYRLEVDNTVLMKALDHFAGRKGEELIFINRDAGLLMHDSGEHFLQLLLQYQDKGISPERIVLEITERNYKGDLEHLDHLLNYYRTYGIKIAVDNMGNDSSRLDRIGQLSPDIIKADLKGLRSNASAASYRDILYSLSLLARRIGATLLFENIEMVYQLQFAWKNGGRYYQGFYLSTPKAATIEKDCLKEKLKTEFHRFILHETKKLEKIHAAAGGFQTKIQELLSKYKKIQDYEELLLALSGEMDGVAFRMYVCDVEGFQQSPNIFKKGEDWIIQHKYYRKNWSWRPYFLENIVRMRNDQKGILSDLYSDIETGETIRTFSFPLHSKDYLFIDIAYSFLYDQEGLL